MAISRFVVNVIDRESLTTKVKARYHFELIQQRFLRLVGSAFRCSAPRSVHIPILQLKPLTSRDLTA
jgi:hypothetical protein